MQILVSLSCCVCWSMSIYCQSEHNF